MPESNRSNMDQDEAQQTTAMNQTEEHPEKLRRRVIALFFSGLLVLALITLGIGWACGDWGKVSLGWFNHAAGFVLTLGGLLMYLGIGVWMGSGVVIILVVIVVSGLLTFIYVHETRELSVRFGDEYLEYRKRTPFLLPRCRRQR